MTAATDLLSPAGPTFAGRSATQLFWERFREDKVAVFGGVVIILLIVIAAVGGWIDMALSRVGDMMLSLPQLLIAIGVVAACSLEGCLGGFIQPGIRVVIGVIAFFTWPYIARIVRGFTLSIREKEFVEASRSLGATNGRII